MSDLALLIIPLLPRYKQFITLHKLCDKNKIFQVLWQYYDKTVSNPYILFHQLFLKL